MDEATAPAAAPESEVEANRRTTGSTGRRGRRRADLLPAVIGLVGVLVGSLTTSGIAYLGARNSRHADERAATRLVAGEIQRDEAALRDLAASGTRDAARPFTTATWREEQTTLARTLDAREWTAVSTFYALLGEEVQVLPTSGCAPADVRNAARRLVREAGSAIGLLGQSYAAPAVGAGIPLRPAGRCRSRVATPPHPRG